jgi:hypothetical protein
MLLLQLLPGFIEVPYGGKSLISIVEWMDGWACNQLLALVLLMVNWGLSGVQLVSVTVDESVRLGSGVP